MSEQSLTRRPVSLAAVRWSIAFSGSIRTSSPSTLPDSTASAPLGTSAAGNYFAGSANLG